jgi:hypothetical protein
MLGGPQSRSGRCGVKKNLLSLSGIEPRPSSPSLYRLSYPDSSQARNQHQINNPKSPLAFSGLQSVIPQKTEELSITTALRTSNPTKKTVMLRQTKSRLQMQWVLCEVENKFSPFLGTDTRSLTELHSFLVLKIRGAGWCTFVLYLKIPMLTDAIIQKSSLLIIPKKKKTLNDPVNVRINRGKLKY